MNIVQVKNEHCSQIKTVLREKLETNQRLKCGSRGQKTFKKALKWPQMRYPIRP